MVTVALMKKFVLVMQLRLVGAPPPTDCDKLFGMQPATPDAEGKLPGDTGSASGVKISDLWKGTLLCAKQLVTEGRELQKAQKLGTWRNTEYARDLTKVDYTLDYLSSNELLNSFVVAHRLQKKSYLKTLAQTVAWEKHMQPYAKIEIPKYSDATFKYEREKDGLAPHSTLVDNALAVGTNADHDVKEFIDDTRKQILANSYTDKWSENFQPMWGKWTTERGYEKNAEKWKHAVYNLKEEGQKEYAALTARYKERETEINRRYPNRKGVSETPVDKTPVARPNPDCINLLDLKRLAAAEGNAHVINLLKTIDGIGKPFASAILDAAENDKLDAVNWDEGNFEDKFDGIFPPETRGYYQGKRNRRDELEEPPPWRQVLKSQKDKFTQGTCGK